MGTAEIVYPRSKGGQPGASVSISNRILRSDLASMAGKACILVNSVSTFEKQKAMNAMNEVVKAGVLEVTVVQALGVALPRTTRRKPSLVARVTVDGTTKSGQTAQRSNHPVWFPAQPLNPGDGNASSSSSHSDARGSGSGSGPRKSGPSARVFSRAMGSSDSGSGNNAHSEDREEIGGSLNWARARYGGGAGGGGGGGGSGGAEGSGAEDVEPSDSGGGSGSVARGLLFEVREFYGPTRIVVELVSGGNGGGGGVGGTVLGACEARLAEALVGRAGGAGSTSKLGKAASFGLDKEAKQQRAVGVYPPLEEKHDSPLLLAERHDTSGGGGGGGGGATIVDVGAGVGATVQPRAPSHSAADVEREADRDRDGGHDLPDSPSHSPRPVDAGGDFGADVDADVGVAVLVDPAPLSTAAATVDTADTTPEGCVGCLPGGGVFARWRRRHRRGGRRESFSDGASEDSARGVAGTSASRVDHGGGGGSVDGVSGASAGKMSWRTSTRNSSGSCSRSGSRSGSGGLSAGKAGSRGSGGISSTLSKKVAGESSKPKTLTLEGAETLATSNWGGGGGSARDIWKELVHVGGGGNVGKGRGSGAGSGGVGLGPSGPAVRLRLRFIPLWDCLSDGGGVNGLGALHAAARDGDARLVTSLVHLWQSLSPGSQVLSLPCRRGLTPIQHCIEAGKESALRELLRGIARDSLRGRGKEGEDTPLHTAIKAGEEGMLRMLLAQTRRTEMPSRVLNAIRLGLGVPPNTMVDAVGSDGLTPLALAAICGNETMVKCLLEEGANAAWVDARRMTPIAHAAHGGNLLAVRALLKAKATGSTGSGVPGLRRSRLARMACGPCKTNEEGMGPVALAAASGSAQVVSELLRADIPYRTRDRDGRTPLHLAARNGHIPVLRVLVAEMRKSRDKRGPRSGGGDGADGAPPGDNTLMMDGGPFKLCNLDLYGRTAHATAVLHQHPQAAAFLEAAAAELEPPRNPKDEEDAAPKHHGSNSSGKRRGGSAAALLRGRGGHPPRASTASPIPRLAQSSGSSSAQGSGTSGRPSPVSSGGLGSGGSGASVLESCNSYEYIESDQE